MTNDSSISSAPSSSMSADKVSGRPKSSKIITFYSYKGGVGRSMALANIAVLLARDHGLNVIAVDWDLEAPGLHRFFGLSDDELDEGVIDYLHLYKALIRDPKQKISMDDLSIVSYLRKIDSFGSGGQIYLLGAGAQKDKAQYTELVRTFDWENFYREWNGARVIESMRTELKDIFDVCLIDSRTGITDIGGICTLQLPDIVVFIFAFNAQNIYGIGQIAREIANPDNQTVKALQRRPKMIFLPSRKELSEVGRLREWEGNAARRLEIYCDTPQIRQAYGDVLTYFRKISIPYVPYFAYGEELAVKSMKGIELTESFEQVIGLLLPDANTQLQVVYQTTRKDVLFRWIRFAAPGVTVTASILGGLLGLYAGIRGLGSHFSWTTDVMDWFSSRSVIEGIKGVAGGALGSLISFFSKNFILIREDAWKVSQGRLASEIIFYCVGGSLFGLVASLIVGESSANFLIYFAAGYAWPALARDAISTRRRD
jgi:hypothetical protein